MHRLTLRLIALAVAIVLAAPAGAAEKLRVGKAQAQQFAFVPLDVGVAAGIFHKHGLDIEIANFGGDAKLLQALAAGSIDMALGGGPTIAFVAKGTPMLGVAAIADAPGTIMLVVKKDGPVKTEDDLKGRTVSVSTAGSLTYWLAKELSRRHGWGNDGIKIAPLGTPVAQVAALRTGQVDGVVTETNTILRLEEEGVGRILVRFRDRIKDFHVHAAFASRALIAQNPDAVRNFLAAWFETIGYMETHKDETVAIAARVAGVSPSVAARNYDEIMPIFNRTGHFEPKALAVLAGSFVDMGLLPEKPDMSKLYTEQFLPKP
ncbi:MAG TPA: ABC transporter substrate-binding protein [Xanthobacteraceae bacterium]|nr:ABC transporter substrate-binding protein [Xanthobacteraceae bacterium]